MPATSIIDHEDGRRTIHLGQLQEGPYMVYEWRQVARPKEPEKCLAGSGYEYKSVPVIYSLKLVGQDQQSWYYRRTLLSAPEVKIVDVTDTIYEIKFKDTL